LRLLPNSLSIDAGDNTAIPAGITTDFDGLDRIVDADCNGTATVDMGAHEFDRIYFGDFAGGCEINLLDFSVIASYWLQDNPEIDIAPIFEPDGIIDYKELLVLADNWLAGQ